jgi:hypothetical protein
LPFGLTKIKDFVRANPDKKCLKSNFFVNSALEFSNAELGLNRALESKKNSWLIFFEKIIAFGEILSIFALQFNKPNHGSYRFKKKEQKK